MLSVTLESAVGFMNIVQARDRLMGVQIPPGSFLVFPIILWLLVLELGVPKQAGTGSVPRDTNLLHAE